LILFELSREIMYLRKAQLSQTGHAHGALCRWRFC